LFNQVRSSEQCWYWERKRVTTEYSSSGWVRGKYAPETCEKVQEPVPDPVKVVPDRPRVMPLQEIPSYKQVPLQEYENPSQCPKWLGVDC
jgi:hypothetical protein